MTAESAVASSRVVPPHDGERVARCGRDRDRFYRDVAELVVLVIDSARLRAEVRYELADGDSYPHLYGPLEIGAVIDVRVL